MNKNFFKIAALTAFAGLILTSCGSSKVAERSANSAGNPFGDVYEAPCAELDSETEFAATGIAEGSKAQMGTLQLVALGNAQDVVRRKMQHSYKGMVSGYMNQVGTNAGNDLENKLEAAGNQIIDKIVNDTRATCGPKFSGVDDKGNVSCYIGIRISKKQVADAIANQVSNDEELSIRFKEEEFRKRMEEKFADYKEGQK
jgi:hypothetical protein